MMHKPAALALLLALSGCGGLLRTDYQRPEIREPAAWKQPPPRAGRRRRLVAQLQRSRTEPAGRAGAGAQQRPGCRRDPATARASIGRPGRGQVDPTTGRVRQVENLWSICGAADPANDAAAWEALATVQDRESTALSLVGTTATLYWRTAFINQRIATSESIAYALRTQDLVRAQYRAGGPRRSNWPRRSRPWPASRPRMPCWCSNAWNSPIH